MRSLLAFASEAFQCFVLASNRPMLINLITDSKRFIFFFFFLRYSGTVKMQSLLASRRLNRIRQ